MEEARIILKTISKATGYFYDNPKQNYKRSNPGNNKIEV